MNLIPTIMPISDLRKDAAAIIKRVIETGEPAFITQRGRAAAVILSNEAYSKTMRELGILRAIAEGEADIARGATRSMEDVFAALDRAAEP